jgi:hypothetical protein
LPPVNLGVRLFGEKMQTEKAFSEFNWHDNHVHAFTIESGVDGTGKLLLDIDHITEWLCEEPVDYAFMVAPATLTFHQVFNLTVSIDYSSPSMAIAPFSIHQIHREALEYPTGYASFKWRIELNSPSGEISFEAPSFSQHVRSEAQRSKNQWLSREARQTTPTKGELD